MAFRVADIPGPQLINTNFGDKIAELGEMFARKREDQQAREILADLRSSDPASADAAEARLISMGGRWGDVGLRIRQGRLTAEDRAASREIQRGQLEEQRARTGMAQERFGWEKTEAERLRKAQEDFARVYSTPSRLPSDDTDVPAPSPQRAPPPPDVGAEPKRPWWDRPETPAETPGPQSALPDRQPLASNTGIGPPDRLAAPGIMSVGPGRDEPDVSPVGERGPQFAQVASATRTDEAGPQLRPASMRERTLRTEIDRLHGLATHEGATPKQVEAIKIRANALERERAELQKRRETALEKQEQSILREQEQARKVEEEPKKELGKKLIAETRSLGTQENILREIGAIARTPGYSGGAMGRLAAVDAAVMPQILPKDMTPGFVQGFIDKGTLVRRVDTLSKELTKAAAGERGIGGQGFTDKDRDFIGSINPSVDDPQQVLQLKAEAGLAVVDRGRETTRIIRDGLAQGRTVAEIDDGVAKYAEKYPLFVTKDGKLTDLGRRVNPALARSMGQPNQRPPQAAIDYLRKNPGLAADFESQFGLAPGGARRYLGGD